MSEPDFHDILLRAFFPNGILPHQYENVRVLMIYINELYDLQYQVQRYDKEYNNKCGTKQQDAPPVDTKQLQNDPDISSKPYIIGTYPSNFEEAPIEPAPKDKPKRMGRPPREPGSLGIKCPKCGSSDVVAGGYGPNKERRIKCKACGSQPIAERPFFSDRIDERILQMEFEDLSPDEISERLKADGASIPGPAIAARLEELHEVVT